MSNILLSSSFQNKTFLNRSRVINLLANNTRIDNKENDTYVLLSLNIRNATVSNNNLTFKISDFDAFIWNDRKLNGQNNQNFSIKLNNEDKIQVIKNIYDEKLIGKYSVYNNNVNTQLNLMNIENGKININTVFSTNYDYNITDTEITLNFKPNVNLLYNGTQEEVNIPDGLYSLVSVIFDVWHIIVLGVGGLAWLGITSWNEAGKYLQELEKREKREEHEKLAEREKREKLAEREEL